MGIIVKDDPLDPKIDLDPLLVEMKKALLAYHQDHLIDLGIQLNYITKSGNFLIVGISKTNKRGHVWKEECYFSLEEISNARDLRHEIEQEYERAAGNLIRLCVDAKYTKKGL